MNRCSTVLLMFLAVPAFAAERPAVFCEGRYALCIKAPCKPIVSRSGDRKYAIEEANCSCEVETGWSMGPGSCDERKPATRGDRTYLISTYSNLFNESNQTLTCESKETVWAMCYGAPCVVDENDPAKAICTCPVKTGKAMTLGGDCRKTACRDIWSAGTPADDTFANNHFYKYMKEHNLQPPPLPPAKECP